MTLTSKKGFNFPLGILKLKLHFKFAMHGPSQGESEGRVNSCFANIPASLCQSFPANHSPSQPCRLSQLSAPESLMYFNKSCFQYLVSTSM